MEIINFFILRSKLSSTNALFSAFGINLNRNEGEIDDHFKLIKGNFDGIDFPVIFRQERKGNLNDILDVDWVSLYLISENLKKNLEDSGLTGWKVFPIRLFDFKGNEINGYYGFSIVGKCGPTNLNQSEIIEKRLVPNGPLSQYYKGISFDNWDGSDFFTPDQTYQIFITEKVAETLKKNKVTNLEMKKISEYEISVDTVQNMRKK